MKTSLTLITTVLLISSHGFISPVSAQWFPYVIDPTEVGADPVGVADLDGDGDPDLIAVDYFGNRIVWYENDNLNWRKDTVDINIVGPTFCRLADIDGDGDPDIVTQGNFANLVVWYENNLPDPVWPKHIIDDFLVIAEFVDVGDIDNDGDWDVVAVGYGASDVVWYENNLPDTIWRKSTIDNHLNGATTVTFGDLDGDGDLDVVATGALANDVVWYENNLPSTVWNKNYIDANLARAYVVNVGDIDSDNDIDVVVGGRNANELVWYENNLPDSVWAEHIIDGDLSDVMGGFIADLDNDNRPDIIPIGIEEGATIWYKNTLPTWEKKIIESGIASTEGYPVDLDGDGRLDLIINSMSNISAWLNNRPGVAQVKSLQSHPRFIPPQGETLAISSRLYNPENHQVSIYAIIQGDQHTFKDSLQLYDDGLHSDSLASDNIYGNSKWFSDLAEDTYTIGISTYDLAEDYPSNFPPTLSFTTIGPVVVDHDSIPAHSPAGFRLTLYLRNDGLVATAKGITASVSTNDTTHVTDIQNPTQSFGDITAGDVKGSSADYIVITENNPDSIKFAVLIYSDGDHFWTDTFNVDLPLTGIDENRESRPVEFALFQNYPNPFNPSTTIGFEIPKSTNVKIEVFNIEGQKIRTLLNKKLSAGNHEIEFNAGNLSSGVYFYKIEAGEFQDVKKMILIR